MHNMYIGIMYVCKYMYTIYVCKKQYFFITLTLIELNIVSQ